MRHPLTAVKHETRPHPFYNGVTEIINSNTWLCEFIEPKKKMRVRLGSFPTAEMAARAYDVAALAFHGDSAPVNFSDSKWHFRIPPSYKSLNDLRFAAMEVANLFKPKNKTSYMKDCRSATSASGRTEKDKVMSSTTPSESMEQESCSSSEKKVKIDEAKMEMAIDLWESGLLAEALLMEDDLFG